MLINAVLCPQSQFKDDNFASRSFPLYAIWAKIKMDNDWNKNVLVLLSFSGKAELFMASCWWVFLCPLKIRKSATSWLSFYWKHQENALFHYGWHKHTLSDSVYVLCTYQFKFVGPKISVKWHAGEWNSMDFYRLTPVSTPCFNFFDCC